VQAVQDGPVQDSQLVQQQVQQLQTTMQVRLVCVQLPVPCDSFGVFSVF
jgi:hypothetical protein